MESIKVVGHKIPDTDCTLSSIIMADFLEKKGYKAEYFIQGKLNKETSFVLEQLKIEKLQIKTSFEKGTNVCLVDHNERKQTLDNIDELNLKWIVDHHKFDLKTSTPLNIKAEPLCSTASVLYNMYKENNFEISEKIANLMLVSIISDSLLFRSATTTKQDVLIAEDLKKLSTIGDISDFAKKMFDAKSDISDLSIEEIIKYDYKEFDFDGKKIGIGVLETTNPSFSLNKKDEILEGLKDLKQKDDLDFIMLSVVDIIGEKNITIILDEDSEKLKEAFGCEIKKNLADLKNSLSRKKQIVPKLEKVF